jgi:hypothetical protein
MDLAVDINRQRRLQGHIERLIGVGTLRKRGCRGRQHVAVTRFTRLTIRTFRATTTATTAASITALGALPTITECCRVNDALGHRPITLTGLTRFTWFTLLQWATPVITAAITAPMTTVALTAPAIAPLRARFGGGRWSCWHHRRCRCGGRRDR